MKELKAILKLLGIALSDNDSFAAYKSGKRDGLSKAIKLIQKELKVLKKLK